jgi:hypothetical protein
MSHQWAGKRKIDIYKCRTNHQNESTPQQKPESKFDHEAKALKVRASPISINTAQGVNTVTNKRNNPTEQPKKQQGARSSMSIRANLDVMKSSGRATLNYCSP